MSRMDSTWDKRSREVDDTFGNGTATRKQNSSHGTRRMGPNLKVFWSAYFLKALEGWQPKRKTATHPDFGPDGFVSIPKQHVRRGQGDSIKAVGSASPIHCFRYFRPMPGSTKINGARFKDGKDQEKIDARFHHEDDTTPIAYA